jgi:hypothetical protein
MQSSTELVFWELNKLTPRAASRGGGEFISFLDELTASGGSVAKAVLKPLRSDL